jgi:RNA 3'-terminal phosphate cyclase (ATP)
LSLKKIDGQQGEGGGQVLRTSLSLAALTGRAVRITNIRAGRKKPGLRPQHLTVVRALAAICRADVQGDTLNATDLTFRPGSPPLGGEYRFDVQDAAAGGSAGSATLILQAVLWPLLFAGTTSQVIIRGGTFVPFSPPHHYVAEVFRPALARFGAQCDFGLHTWGWYPVGGGEIAATIRPVSRLEAVHFTSQPVKQVDGIAAVTNLPAHIPHRMARRAENLLHEMGLASSVRPARERGPGPGAGLVLWTAQAGFSHLGRKGLPADKVAEAAVAELGAFIDNRGAVDRHLADQLLLPMALAHGESSLTTGNCTAHLFTNAAVLAQWLEAPIQISGAEGQPGRVAVQGAGITNHN